MHATGTTRLNIVVRQNMLTRSLLISAALYGANSLSIGDDRHKTYHDILKVIESNDISSVEVSSNRTVGMTSGYFVTTVYTTMTCAKNSEFTASGTTLGSCISATADSSYRYTSCSQSGSKTVVGMDSCTSGDCSSGCSSFDVPFDTGCQTMSMMTCSSQDEPWRAYDFDYHAL